MWMQPEVIKQHHVSEGLEKGRTWRGVGGAHTRRPQPWGPLRINHARACFPGGFYMPEDRSCFPIFMSSHSALQRKEWALDHSVGLNWSSCMGGCC